MCKNTLGGTLFCHGWSEKHYMYFSEHKTEIIHNGENKVWFIYKNVNKRMTCTNFLCRKGDGILKKIAYSQDEALISADADYFVKKEKAEQEKKEEEEKKIAVKQSELAPMINSAKSTCKTLGFEEGTDKFTDCALKLYTQEVENKVAIEVAKQQASGSSSSGSMTIYDPVRDRQNQIDRGMKMLGGGCTLGIDC